MLLIGNIRQAVSLDTKQTIVSRGPLKGMRLNPSQERHFVEVEQIMENYHYQRRKSVVFSTQLSMATLCYLESVPCGLFFQPTDFVARASHNLAKPDFLFLSKYDKYVADKVLKELSWGWPEEFDEYNVGTPESKDPGYSTERWLYCRRSLKK